MSAEASPGPSLLVLLVIACGPGDEPATVSQCADDEPGTCVGLSEVAGSRPADANADDWSAAIEDIRSRLEAAEDRYARLDIALYQGHAYAADNRMPSFYGWDDEEPFDAEAIALLTHSIPQPGIELERDAWTLAMYDLERRVMFEIVQPTAQPSLTEAFAVGWFPASGGIAATCDGCMAPLGDVYGTSAAIDLAKTRFTGVWGTGGEQIIDVSLDLEPAEPDDLGLAPAWLSNMLRSDRRGDELGYVDYCEGEIVVRNGLLKEPYPVPPDLPYDECSRDVQYSATAYISEDCPERYGARNLAIEPPTVCCWYNCYDCPERYCLDPAEYEF